ncbi:MAG: TrkA family potassium uptake protein [Jiangellales bacterium]
MPRRRNADVARQNVLVIGLGVFGSSVAETLVSLGHEVLGVDENPDVVADVAPRITSAVEGDGSSEETLRQLGASDFARGLVAVGDLEASVLAASNLVDLGVPQVWAKALSDRHARILERIGVHRVVSPEREQGNRVGHLIGGTMLDFIEVDDGWALVKVLPLPESIGQSLGESRLRELYGITVVGTKRPGKPFQFARRETVVHHEDALIIAGETRLCEQFSAIAEAARTSA